MSDLVIELILIAMVVVPLVASTPLPARSDDRNHNELLRSLRRSR